MSNFGGRIMCKAAEVGKIVVNRCLNRGLSIDVQKLQKLLVLMQVECIKRSGKPLFTEDIRIWDCGVAIKEVDEEFRNTGFAFINHQVEYINLLECEGKSVDSILEIYGDKDALELSALPTNQKICRLALATSDTKTPHINYKELVREFRPNESC